MKRFLAILGFLALLALLVGGVAALRARRAAACDRELERLISGPLLPGSEAVRSQWMFGIHGEQDLVLDFVVKGESVLEPGSEPGTDVIRHVGPGTENGADSSHWTIRTGTPTEQRFFDFLRAACDTGILVLNETNGVRSSRNRAFVQGFPPDALPEKTRIGYATFSPEMDERSRRELRERVGAFFEREAARDDVVLREEAVIPFSLLFVMGPRQLEEPGIVRRAVAWTCDRLSLSFLDSVSEWANRDVFAIDPLQRLCARTVYFIRGAPQTGVRDMPDKNWSEPVVFFPPPETVVPIGFEVSDETPLAAAIRDLCETCKPWTLGESVPSLAPGEAFHLGKPVLIGQDGTNKWTVVPDRTSPRFRSFMLDFLRLLADPPRDMRNEPCAKSNP